MSVWYPRLRDRPLLLGAVVALLAAALLVAYLQRQFVRDQREQTDRILQQACERTALALVGQIRQLFEAPVPETLEQLDHTAFLDYHPSLLASPLAAGLRRHPFIERFFIWSPKGPAAFRDQVLFFRPAGEPGPREIPIDGPNREDLGGLFADPLIGRAIVKASLALARSKRNFTIVDRQFRNVPYQVIIHYQWENAGRTGNFAFVGYTVNLQKVGDDFLRSVLDADQTTAASVDARAPRLTFAVLDEFGARIYGPPVATSTTTASRPLDLLFFPSSMTSWINGPPRPVRWRLVVNVAAAQAVPWFDRYRLSAAVIVLIAVALFCAIAVNRQSTRLARMHADFVANVTHQLKTPLSLLSAAAETLRLQRVSAPERVKEYAEVMQGQTERLSGLVEQILMFSRLEASPGIKRFTRLELIGLMRQSVDRVGGGALESSRIKFHAPVEPMFVEGDSDALEEAMVNLVDNALKYGDDKDVTVLVERVNSHAIVVVRDQGIGIEAADQKRIFEKFYRGHHDGHRVQGFGLGLSIVQHVLKAHHGRVVVRSRPGGGSEFRVSLPVLPL